MNVQTGIENIILTSLAIFVIYNFVNLGVRLLTRQLFTRFKNEAAALENDPTLHKNFKKNSRLSKERAILEVSVKRLSSRFDMSIAINNIEFILLTSTTILILSSFGDNIDYTSLSKIGVVALSWLVIKLLGCNGQWRQPIFGASIFSIFLLTSIVNIALGFFAGYLLAGYF